MREIVGHERSSLSGEFAATQDSLGRSSLDCVRVQREQPIEEPTVAEHLVTSLGQTSSD